MDTEKRLESLDALRGFDMLFIMGLATLVYNLCCLFPYMQAVRFFADYINGDTYYKIKYPDHNLVRTRNQVALFHAAYAKVPQMKAFIDSL